MRSFSKLVAGAAAIACAATLAFAADQTILGKSLTVKQKPGDPTSRKIASSAKEKNSPNTLVGDPTQAGNAGGAILQVFANGANATSQTFNLPQDTSSTGKQFWTASGTTGFKYKDSKGDQGAVRSVSIKRSKGGAFSIKVKIAGRNGPLTVVPPNPGISGCVALKLGISASAGDRYSFQFGPDSQLKNQEDKLFKAKKPTLQGICPANTTPTTTTSTTAAPVSTTTSTTGATIPTTTSTSTTTTTTIYGSPSRAFLAGSTDLLD